MNPHVWTITSFIVSSVRPACARRSLIRTNASGAGLSQKIGHVAYGTRTTSLTGGYVSGFGLGIAPWFSISKRASIVVFWRRVGVNPTPAALNALPETSKMLYTALSFHLVSRPEMFNATFAVHDHIVHGCTLVSSR